MKYSVASIPLTVWATSARRAETIGIWADATAVLFYGVRVRLVDTFAASIGSRGKSIRGLLDFAANELA